MKPVLLLSVLAGATLCAAVEPKPQAGNAVVEHDPVQALSALDVHPELKAQLFASEPLLVSPSSIDVDARGRVWVCEVINYRSHKGERPEGDRILILEDTDGDAKADKQSVFHQGKDVDSAHGICVLGNKALISCGDDVFWLIDDNGDDKADRKELMFTKIGGVQHDHGIHAAHFGPDGRLYFNFGNGGKQLCDKNGQLITDIHGIKCTNQNNRPYQQGLVFRCELDGSNVELLAWNFRNNWEVAVDSFGTMWQSDNDDDGNKAVRINYVMEFGNYGYSDEVTGEGWQIPRPGLESEIPQRHWHQNDPGVVPNVLITGAGSPTGMQVYEGNLLPEVFRGQPIHCDAGPNVVRCYVMKPDGAGYQAEVVNILEGSRDKWFRPSDVCVAPDGSLIVADWYDPGVGGHGMGDTGRGRLFRVTVPGKEKYEVLSSQFSVKTVEEAVAALMSPNEAARYLGWQALEKMGGDAEPALKAVFENRQTPPHHRARALWGLESSRGLQPAKMSKGKTGGASGEGPADGLKPDTTLAAALTDTDPNIRITAIRLARRLWQQKQPEKLREFMAQVKPSSDTPAINRELAIAIRFDDSGKANDVWAELTRTMMSTDRWSLEAWGIGTDLMVNPRWEHLAKRPDVKVDDYKLWRAAPKATSDPLGIAFLANGTEPFGAAQQGRVLRSLQLRAGRDPHPVAKAAMALFMEPSIRPDTALAATALLSRDAIAADAKAQTRLESLLAPVMGKPEFVGLVERLSLTGFERELLDFITANPQAPESINAGRLLAANRDKTAAFLKQANPGQAKKLVSVLGKVSDRASVAVLSAAFWPDRRDDVRRAIIEALALSNEGGKVILRWNSEGKLPDAVKATAALAMSRSTDAGLRDQAAAELPLPAALGAEQFPPLAELMKMTGDAAKGSAMFAQAGCVACHQVKGQFINFGPDLTQIGNKLSKDGLFTAILYPSAAIEHSFTGLTISTKAGQQAMGYIISETEDELTLRINGGAAQPVKKASITKREEMTQSLMPPGLAAPIGPQGLVDLVAFLQTLK